MNPTFQRGQVYPLFGFFLVAFIGLSALAIDLGYWRYQERAQQTATDSAAIAGAQASVFPSPNALNAAVADAATNGFATPAATVSIDPNYSDAYTSNSGGAVKVTITKSYPRFFSGLFGSGGQAIATTAVAKLAQIGSGCLTGLDPNGSMDLHGQKMQGSGCSIEENGTLKCSGGDYTVIVGIILNSANNSNVSCKDGPASTYTSVISDPCPYVPGCNAYSSAQAADHGLSCVPSASCLAPACSTPQTPPGSGGTATPGCYSGATFNNSTVFDGNYVFVNGVTFNNNMTTGPDGASFYIASPGGSGKNSFGLNVSSHQLGTSSAPFSAPTSGAYAGILFYQPAVNTGGLSLSANIWASGMWYFPSVSWTEDGKHTHAYTGDLVFGSMTFNGGNNTTLQPLGANQAGTPEVAILVE